MKTYTFEGKEYIESDEDPRLPKEGEVFYWKNGNGIQRALFDFREAKQIILIPKEEKMKTKYEILKDITPKVIFEKGDLSCEEFCGEYSDFLRYFLNERKKTFGEKLDLSDIEDIYNRKPASWINFLVENKLIRKKKEEKTYHTGQKFFYKGDNEKYLLGRRNGYKVFLVCLDDGNIWNDGVIVKDFNNITKTEFKEIVEGSYSTTDVEKFELIE